MQHWSTGGYWDLFGAKESSLKLKTTMWVWFTYVGDSCHPPLSKNHGSMTMPFVPGRSWFKLNKLEENNVMRTFIFQKDMKWLCFLFQGWDICIGCLCSVTLQFRTSLDCVAYCWACYWAPSSPSIEVVQPGKVDSAMRRWSSWTEEPDEKVIRNAGYGDVKRDLTHMHTKYLYSISIYIYTCFGHLRTHKLIYRKRSMSRNQLISF